MIAKELIAAAESLSHEAARYFEEYMIEDHDDPDSHGLFERIDLVTDHILATVRPDDDEPLTEDWFGAFAAKAGQYRFEFSIGRGRSFQIDELHDKTWAAELLIDSHNRYGIKDDAECGFEIQTRGDFRQLCRLLGVALKESE